MARLCLYWLNWASVIIYFLSFVCWCFNLNMWHRNFIQWRHGLAIVLGLFKPQLVSIQEFPKLQPSALNGLQVLFHQTMHFLQRSQCLVHVLMDDGSSLTRFSHTCEIIHEKHTCLKPSGTAHYPDHDDRQAPTCYIADCIQMISVFETSRMFWDTVSSHHCTIS